VQVLLNSIDRSEPFGCRDFTLLYLAAAYGLRFERERLWYEFPHAGFSAADLKQVVSYLQKEIRAPRRNVGALKLSNLLQLDRFEEDLHISRVRLKPLVQRPEPALSGSAKLMSQYRR